MMINGHHILLLKNGTAYFPALLEAIRQAKQTIYLETYIFEFDHIGRQVADALIQAALRGVRVHLMLDGFGCRHFPVHERENLEKSGVQVLLYRPKVSPWTFKRNRLRRMHRKVGVIDGMLAFVGGINIIDDYNTPEHVAPRIDYAVQIQGPLVQQIQSSVVRLWRRIAWMQFRKKQPELLPNPSVHTPAGTMRALFVERDNVLHRRDIEDTYLRLIAEARQEIIIANSYFLPGVRFRKAMRQAAQRGVRVTLLLQARVEYVLLEYASKALYDDLLNDGIELYEYSKSFMHSKVAVIDNRWAMVGSSNIDPFSLLLSREANVLVEDATFATMLKADLLETMRDGAHRLTLDRWQKRRSLRSWLYLPIYTLLRLAMGVIGYSEEYPV